jgi:hypothetical protein
MNLNSAQDYSRSRGAATTIEVVETTVVSSKPAAASFLAADGADLVSSCPFPDSLPAVIEPPRAKH